MDIETIKKTELESIKGLLKTNAKVQAELLTENERLAKINKVNLKAGREISEVINDKS